MFLVRTLILLLLTIASIPNTSYPLRSLFREVIQEDGHDEKVFAMDFCGHTVFPIVLEFHVASPE